MISAFQVEYGRRSNYSCRQKFGDVGADESGATLSTVVLPRSGLRKTWRDREPHWSVGPFARRYIKQVGYSTKLLYILSFWEKILIRWKPINDYKNLGAHFWRPSNALLSVLVKCISIFNREKSEKSELKVWFLFPQFRSIIVLWFLLIRKLHRTSHQAVWVHEWYFSLAYQNHGDASCVWDINDWSADVLNELQIKKPNVNHIKSTESEEQTAPEFSTETVIVCNSAASQAVLRALLKMEKTHVDSNSEYHWPAGLLMISPGIGMNVERYVSRVMSPESLRALKNGETLLHPSADPKLRIKVDLKCLNDFVNVSSAMFSLFISQAFKCCSFTNQWTVTLKK